MIYLIGGKYPKISARVKNDEHAKRLEDALKLKRVGFIKYLAYRLFTVDTYSP